MTGLVNAYPSADYEGETVTETETYTYYPNGNKKTVTDMTGKLIQYTYDNAGRLTAETVDGVSTSYTYDGYNNRIGKTKNGVQTSYLYDNRNRLTRESFTKNGQTTVTSYQYDPNGNLYSRQTLTYGDNTIQTPEVSAVLMGYTADTNDMLLEYNNFNQLTTVTKGNDIITYDYYANGMRKSKTVDGVTTTHIWDGQNMAGEEIQDGFVSYLRGNHLIARQTGDTTQYYHFNGHGDTLSITNENGTTLQNYAYDAFGNLTSNNAEDINPFRYCGEYFDQETGFIYLRARYYAPEIGRFISEDPIRDGLNWYAYCGNNPVNRIDPSGKAWETIFDLISFAISVGDVIANPTDALAWAGLAGDAVDFIPFVTGVGETIKGTKSAVKITDTVIDAGKTVDTAVDIVDGISDNRKLIKSLNGLSENVGYNSFDALKRAIGPAGDGKHWHHIVEQSQIQKSGFSAEQIHNTSNIIAVDANTHVKLTGHYNTTTFEFTNGKSVRDWLAGQSYEVQYDYGIKILKEFGVIE